MQWAHKTCIFVQCGPLYDAQMFVPHSLLSPSALRGVIYEYVTRDGTDYSDVEPRIAAVVSQLNAGSVRLNFDTETQSCNIVPK